ncbi:MAG: hypothetical protein H6622_14095 [Halobacteriovoraceae bacterium]|nr:hypothetical protein [Halobacteriovoraceae bacterium]
MIRNIVCTFYLIILTVSLQAHDIPENHIELLEKIQQYIGDIHEYGPSATIQTPSIRLVKFENDTLAIPESSLAHIISIMFDDYIQKAESHCHCHHHHLKENKEIYVNKIFKNIVNYSVFVVKNSWRVIPGAFNLVEDIILTESVGIRRFKWIYLMVSAIGETIDWLVIHPFIPFPTPICKAITVAARMAGKRNKEFIGTFMNYAGGNATLVDLLKVHIARQEYRKHYRELAYGVILKDRFYGLKGQPRSEKSRLQFRALAHNLGVKLGINHDHLIAFPSHHYQSFKKWWKNLKTYNYARYHFPNNGLEVSSKPISPFSDIDLILKTKDSNKRHLIIDRHIEALNLIFDMIQETIRDQYKNKKMLSFSKTIKILNSLGGLGNAIDAYKMNLISYSELTLKMGKTPNISAENFKNHLKLILSDAKLFTDYIKLESANKTGQSKLLKKLIDMNVNDLVTEIKSHSKYQYCKINALL